MYIPLFHSDICLRTVNEIFGKHDVMMFDGVVEGEGRCSSESNIPLINCSFCSRMPTSNKGNPEKSIRLNEEVYCE